MKILDLELKLVATVVTFAVLGATICSYLVVRENKQCHGQCSHGSQRIECQQRCLKANYCPIYGEE